MKIEIINIDELDREDGALEETFRRHRLEQEPYVLFDARIVADGKAVELRCGVSLTDTVAWYDEDNAPWYTWSGSPCDYQPTLDALEKAGFGSDPGDLEELMREIETAIFEDSRVREFVKFVKARLESLRVELEVEEELEAVERQ